VFETIKPTKINLPLLSSFGQAFCHSDNKMDTPFIITYSGQDLYLMRFSLEYNDALLSKVQSEEHFLSA
jgi:hypothetical protein